MRANVSHSDRIISLLARMNAEEAHHAPGDGQCAARRGRRLIAAEGTQRCTESTAVAMPCVTVPAHRHRVPSSTCPAGVMVLPLKGDELVHGRECLGISSVDADFATARQVIHGIGDRVALRRHDRGARHFPVVYEGRCPKSPLVTKRRSRGGASGSVQSQRNRPPRAATRCGRRRAQRVEAVREAYWFTPIARGSAPRDCTAAKALSRW